MLVLRQAARKSEQTERAGDKKSHKGGSSLQVNISILAVDIIRAWLFDYKNKIKAAAVWLAELAPAQGPVWIIPETKALHDLRYARANRPT